MLHASSSMMCDELFATFTTGIDYRVMSRRRLAKRLKVVFTTTARGKARREHLILIRSHESKKRGERVTFCRDVEISWNRCGRRMA